MPRRKSEKTVAQKISDFVGRNTLKNIPREVRDIAKLHLLDGLATMLGGAKEPSSRILCRHYSRLGSKAEATVVGTNVRIATEHAALVNGVQAHVLDYDDAQLTTLAVPSARPTNPSNISGARRGARVSAKPARQRRGAARFVHRRRRSRMPLGRRHRSEPLSRRLSSHRHARHIRRSRRLCSLVATHANIDPSRLGNRRHDDRRSPRQPRHHGQRVKRRARRRERRDCRDSRR